MIIAFANSLILVLDGLPRTKLLPRCRFGLKLFSFCFNLLAFFFSSLTKHLTLLS